ncbi:hypothetical protein BCR35DRAFT_292372 [Leucosporidium creatinivorum]|uniref:Uncharacterized protein n=1 Tax=Leucosporidium creatinivorum TaxID=106004 RepID=A0A1Y2EZ55_9BASI|nr:hypothetical protein BCR35DRAFT_292372 [Leucosporidium creatinivorum]
MALHRDECTIVYRQAFKISKSSTLDTLAVRLVLTLTTLRSRCRRLGGSRGGLCSLADRRGDGLAVVVAEIRTRVSLQLLLRLSTSLRLENQRTASAVASFIPVHDQPVTLAALKELEPEILTAEVARLQNSIKHLERSNEELKTFCSEADDEDLDDDSRREFEQSVKENEETIASQKERMVMLRLALESQLGVDATNSHYTIAGADSATPSTATLEAPTSTAATPTPSAPNGITELEGGEEEGGLYL